MTEKKCTLFCDIDGTLFHYRKYGTYDTLPVVKIEETIALINKAYKNGHRIMLTTARPESTRSLTYDELSANGVNFHQLIMNTTQGPRILINDNDHDTGGFEKAYAFCVERNEPLSRDDNDVLNVLLFGDS